MRQWHITRDPTIKAEDNCLQRSVTNQLNEWKKGQWSNTKEKLDPENQTGDDNNPLHQPWLQQGG
jgi:hypothetical protein